MRAVLKIFALFILLAALIACGSHIVNSGQGAAFEKAPKAIRVATLNVHYIVLSEQDGPWSVGDWERRKGPLDAAFKAVDADIMAFQEMESFAGGSGSNINLALDYLLENNPNYRAAAVGDPREFPSTQPIFYRADRFRLLDQGWFFFSRTPDVIYSRTFNGSYPAFASWAKFAPTNGSPSFFVFNVHFEYSSRSNRRLSAELVVDRMASIVEDDPAFLLGDLNAMHGSRTMEILEEADLQFPKVSGSTYHFNRGINLFGAIDHIGATHHAKIHGAPVVLRSKFLGEWPTDHYPVFADYHLTER